MQAKLRGDMNINPYQFKAFAYVVREGSLTNAARALGVSQSAVSQHIAKLEAHVGARLLVRARDGVELTATGQEFFDLADRFATLHTIIEEKVQGFSELERGHLKIIANAPQPALDLIARFADTYPNVDIDIALCDWSSAIELLQKRKVDFGVITEPTISTEWYLQRLCTSRFVLYVRDTHDWSRRQVMSLTQIVDETLLLPESGSITQRVITTALDKLQLVPRRIVKTTTFPVMKEAIMAGLGVGIFLENSAGPEAGLTQIPIQELEKHYETSLVVPRHRMDLKLVRSFCQVAEDQL